MKGAAETQKILCERSFSFKSYREVHAVKSTGRLFRSLGAYELNAASPKASAPQRGRVRVQVSTVIREGRKL